MTRLLIIVGSATTVGGGVMGFSSLKDGVGIEFAFIGLGMAVLGMLLLFISSGSESRGHIHKCDGAANDLGNWDGTTVPGFHTKHQPCRRPYNNWYDPVQVSGPGHHGVLSNSRLNLGTRSGRNRAGWFEYCPLWPTTLDKKVKLSRLPSPLFSGDSYRSCRHWRSAADRYGYSVYACVLMADDALQRNVQAVRDAVRHPGLLHPVRAADSEERRQALV